MDVKKKDETHRFRAGAFEGPLDLLLFLIRKAEVSIYDIPIAEITDQYLQFLKYATQINLENITEFYVMATTLLFIKSQMLLPVEFDLEDEASEARQELVDKLIEHQKFKRIGELITQKGRESEWVVERNAKQRVLQFTDEDDMWNQIDVWDLLKTFSGLMSSLSAERIIDLYEEVSINEKLTLIDEYLDTKGQFLFVDLIINPQSVMEIVCSFLAILESAKTRKICIYQNRLFGDIRITSNVRSEGS